MKWLHKKPRDPLSEREHELERELSRIQQEIQRLSESAQAPSGPGPRPAAVKPRSQPRLRSTTLPGRGPARSSEPPGPTAREPIFEDIDQGALKKDAPPQKPSPKLGVRKSGLAALWESLRRYFRGRPASNPKLVNYLAAGSIEGLPPLRYEKRIARNQFLGFAFLLVLLLWGLISLLLRHR